MTDLISRQAAKKAVCSMCRWEGTSNCDECEHPIDELPTIDPVKHGKWEDKGSLSCRCSKCGCKSPKEYSYCPNCGARMDGEENHGR